MTFERLRAGRAAFASGLAGLMAVVVTPALAQTVSTPQVYGPEFYEPFVPQTALDMVRRTPGFVIDAGDEDLRGFGGGGGNVLIDGARPASKAGLLEALGRIPAIQVARIELIWEAQSAEAQGQSLVLNVVRAQTGGSGTWSLEAERNGNGVVYPRLEASYSRPFAGWQTSIRARAYWEEFPFRFLRRNRDASGTLTSSTVQDLPSTLGEANLSGEARRSWGSGHLNLTGRVGWFNYYFDQPGQVFLGRLPDQSPDRRLLNQQDTEQWNFELGGDYTRPLGDYSWKTLALITYQDDRGSSRERSDTATGALLSRSAAERATRPLEIIGRTTLSGPATAPLRPDFGAEVAYNRFDNRFDLAVDQGQGLTPVPVPAANVRVEELRGEAFANLSWTLSPRWTIEGGVAVEASEISVSGEADQFQTYTFVKPSVAAIWRPSSVLQLRAGVRRTVGQLDFQDFAASAELDDDRTNAGNPGLGPDQTTRWYAIMDYRGTGDLAVNLEIFHEDRRDVLEQVRLPSGAAGLANAGDAVYRGIKATLGLPLDRLLSGARLSAEVEVIDTAFDDPLIGRERPLSDVFSPDIELELRRDLPDSGLSWGITWEAAEEGESFRVDEAVRLRGDELFGAFIETTAFGPFKARLAASSIGTLRRQRNRLIFDPDRSGSQIRSEQRFTRGPTAVTLTVTGTF